MKSNIPKGLSFYPMDTGHVTNKRVRLLFNDFGSDGYWIWHCLIDSAYKTHGYYHPASADDIEIFSADICRKPPELVFQVVESCIKRGLFDQNVYSRSFVLTNDKMQVNYLRGTQDRRRKGSKIIFIENHFIIPPTVVEHFGESSFQNVYLNLDEKPFWPIFTSKLSDFGFFHGNTGKLHGVSTEELPFSMEKPENSMLNRNRNRNRKGNTTPENSFSAPEKIDDFDMFDSDLSSLAKKSIPGAKKKPARKKNPDAEPFQDLYVEIFSKHWLELRKTKFKYEAKDFVAIKKISKILRTDKENWVAEVARGEIESLMSKAKHDSFVAKNNFENFTLPIFLQRINSILSSNINGNGTTKHATGRSQADSRGDGRSIEFDPI